MLNKRLLSLRLYAKMSIAKTDIVIIVFYGEISGWIVFYGVCFMKMKVLSYFS